MMGKPSQVIVKLVKFIRQLISTSKRSHHQGVRKCKVGKMNVLQKRYIEKDKVFKIFKILYSTHVVSIEDVTDI